MSKIKDLLNNNTLTLLNYGFGKELIDVYGNAYEDPTQEIPYLGESLLESLKYSTILNLPANWTGLSTALEFLNRKLDAARKTISFWDAYQIRGTVQDRDLILSELAKLPANSAVVNNTYGEVEWRGQIAHQGDIFIKDYNEELYLIKNLSSGYYAPVAITAIPNQGNTFAITYRYFTNDPEIIEPGDEPVTPPAGGEIENPATKHNLPVPLQAEQNGYNLYGTLNTSKTFTYISAGSTVLEPIVKYQILPRNGNWKEELIVDDVYVGDGTSFTLQENSMNTALQSLYTILYEVK